LAFASLYAGHGWVARAAVGFALWYGAFGLGMLGRSVCWGWVRNLFWWYRPLWLADGQATWLTPRPVRPNGPDHLG